MDSLVYKINLDCLRKDSQAIVNAKVGETNGRKIVFTLYEGRSAFFVPEGATAIFRAKKPSGAVLYNSCVINDGKVEYTLTQQTVAEQGVFPCEIQIVGADKKIIYTPCITLDVAQNLYSDAEVESTSEFTALTGAIEEVRASKAFTIKLTTTSNGITADKTFTEIAEKVNAAKSVVINMDGWVFPVSYSADSGKIVFSSLWANIAEIPNTVTFAVNSSDVWNVVVSDIPTTAQVSAKYTKPASGIPKTDLASDVQASLDKAETALQEHQSLAAYRTAAAQDNIDITKQNKLIAGKNITIAADGKTISATSDMDAVIGYFRVTLTERGDGLYTGSKTFAQVKAEIESNKRFMFIDGYDYVFIVTSIGNALIEFAGMIDGDAGWLWVGVTSNDQWEMVPEVRVTLDAYNQLVNTVGNLANLTTTDKTNLVAAVNEVKGIADNKQDKLIAGENITIAADGKTISATGGGGGSGSVQSDWHQNDSTAADYVKNRPFYTGNPVETVLVEESAVSFYNFSGNLYMGTLSQEIPVIVGETYKVYWDSTAYECVCAAADGVPALGNLSIMEFGPDTGEPFLVGIVLGERTEIYTTDTSASHTISISEFVPAIVKIDKKYLPFDVPTKTSQLENDSGFVAASELAAALADKQDKLIAGDNITIAADGKTISATGGSSIPKPLTYDYMPAGYPTKSVQATTLMEEQELAFSDGGGVYICSLAVALEIVEGQTYTVKWDGTEYVCVGVDDGKYTMLGNLSLSGQGADTGEPFLYLNKDFGTLDTSPTHTISVKTTQETITPMSVEFIPTMNVSAFTNDAGYLTLATLPKYEGVVE